MEVYFKSSGKPAERPDAGQEEFRKRLLEFKKRLKKLRDVIDRIDDGILDKIELALIDLEDLLPPLPTYVRKSRRGCHKRPISQRKMARPHCSDAHRDFAENVQFVRRGDGGASICIDGGEWITLKPRLALLLEALLPRPVGNTTAPAGWISDKSLAAHIGERTVDRRVKHRIAQLVYLLRNELENHGVNPELLERDRRSGTRFRLKVIGSLGDVIDAAP